MLKEEENFGIKKYKTYQDFGKKVYKIRENVIQNIKILKKNNKKIIGYGAPAKATTALNYFGVKNDLIDSIIDDNTLKINRYIPGTGIKIISSKSITKKQKCILVLAWNMFDEIKVKNQKLSSNFISIKDLYDKDFIKNFLPN